MTKYLFVIYAAFVVYGTLIPFQIVETLEAAGNHLQGLQWIPFWNMQRGRIASVPDIVQNVILFMPIGALGFYRFKRNLPRTVAAGFLLSFLVETLQLFTIDRTSSLTDVTTNSLGTWLGALLSLYLVPLLKHIIRLPAVQNILRIHGGAHLLALMLYAWIYALEPFDFTLDVSAVWGDVRYLFRELAHPRFVLDDEFILASQFALLGYATAAFLSQFQIKAVGRISMIIVALWAAITEMSQLIVASRMASILTGCFSLMGGAVGILAYDRQAKEPRRRLFFLYGIAVLVAFAVSVWSPFRLRPDYVRPALLPLQHYQADYFVNAFSNILHSLLVFMPLGYAAFQMRFGWKTRGSCLALLFGVVVLLESLQGFIDTRYPDVTDFFLPTAGAFIGWWTASQVRNYLGR